VDGPPREPCGKIDAGGSDSSGRRQMWIAW
jgi:hypothetical protein